MTPEELAAITGRRQRLLAAHREERHAMTEVVVPAVAREHRARGAVPLGDDEWRADGAIAAERPFDVDA